MCKHVKLATFAPKCNISRVYHYIQKLFILKVELRTIAIVQNIQGSKSFTDFTVFG